MTMLAISTPNPAQFNFDVYGVGCSKTSALKDAENNISQKTPHTYRLALLENLIVVSKSVAKRQYKIPVENLVFNKLFNCYLPS